MAYIRSTHFIDITEVESTLALVILSGRNVRWPSRILPLMSHGEYADGTDGRTDARSLHYAFRQTQPA